MAFVPKDWKDHPDTTTPITATALEDVETRLSDYTDDVGDAKQPFDADLTAIAALATTAYGRAFLALADSAAARAAIGSPAIAHSHAQADVTNLAADLAARQPLDSDLTAIAALATTAFGRSVLEVATAAAARALIDATSTTDLSGGLALKQATSEKAQANGYASLDAAAKVPTSQLPSLGLTDVYEVANQAAQLALTAQEGDLAVRTDENKSYVHNGGSAGTMADWTLLRTPADVVLSVNGQTGAVSLAKSDVGLGNADNTSDAGKPVSTATQTALDGKQGLDADLTALAALSTTAYGRSLLEAANAGAGRTLLDAAQAAHAHAQADVTGLVSDLAAKQPLDSDLTAIAALSTTSFGRALLESADAAAVRTAISAAASSHNHDASYQPLDSDLTALAALTQTAYGQALLEKADAAAVRSYIEAASLAANTFTGAQVFSGGVDAIGAGVSGWTPFPIINASTGSEVATTVGTVYFVELFIPVNCTLTGFKWLTGPTVGGSDEGIAILYDHTGAVLANSALAGITITGASTFQTAPFTSTYAAKGPAQYFAGLSISGTGSRARNVDMTGVPPFLPSGSQAAAVTYGGGAFSALTSITPPTAPTANRGPVMSTY